MQNLSKFTSKIIIEKHSWLFVVIILILQLILSYWGIFKYQYIIAPGDDIAAHLAMISSINETHQIVGTSYPPLFHYFILGLSKLFNQDLFTILKLIWPSFLIAAAASIWFVATKIFGRKVGILTLLLYALIALQPLQTARDGGLPNIIGGHVVLVFLLYFYGLTFIHRGKLFWLYLIATIVSFSLLTLTHHLSTLNGLFIIFSSFPFLMYWRLRERKHSHLITFFITLLVFICLLIILIYFFNETDLFRSTRNLSGLFIALINKFPFLVINNREFSPPWIKDEYSIGLNGLVFEGGVAGLFLILYKLFRGKLTDKNKVFGIILVSWFGALFLGSRFAWLGEPGRLARDLVIPAVILSSYFLSTLNQLLAKVSISRVVFWLIIISLIVGGFIAKSQYLISYDKMVRYTDADLIIEKLLSSDYQSTFNILWDNNPGWIGFANYKINQSNTNIIQSGNEAPIIPHDRKSCLFFSIYKKGIWPNWLSAPNHLEEAQLLTNAPYKQIAEDRVKIWYVSCSDQMAN